MAAPSKSRRSIISKRQGKEQGPLEAGSAKCPPQRQALSLQSIPIPVQRPYGNPPGQTSCSAVHWRRTHLPHMAGKETYQLLLPSLQQEKKA